MKILFSNPPSLKLFTFPFLPLLFFILLSGNLNAQSQEPSLQTIKETMLKATNFFDEKVSCNGGYVWNYLSDLSRSWGEMEAYPSMVWIQGNGTVGMGNTFLDSYEATHDEYYYKLAEKSALALAKGQLDCGGWNYMIDFAGESSIKKWYNTIGKNGWRLEEFQHYYGNATFDDESTTGVAKFLLRFYLIKKNDKIKPVLQKAIDLILKSQYSNGGWPQRFPIKDKFSKNGLPDYTPYFTFNDQVIRNNLKFLIACYTLFEDSKYLEPVKRAMNFFLITQQPNPQAGWGMQYSLDLKPAGARTYEPKALDPQFTAQHIEILIKFFEMTGDKKYLSRIPNALKWIESVKLSSSENETRYVVPKFVELGTNKGLFVHRKGTNVKCGSYYFDYENKNLIKHYSSIRTFNLRVVKDEYEKTKNVKPEETTKSSPLVLKNISSLSAIDKFKYIYNYLLLPSEELRTSQSNEEVFSVPDIILQLDKEGRWISDHAITSNPYIGDPICADSLTGKFVSTTVGDEYDTSPFRDTTEQKYISTGIYMKNMEVLINHLISLKNK